MLFHLDISLLDVIFVYIVEMSRKCIFSLSVHISSLQLVTRLPDSSNGAAKGHVVSSYEHPGREFKPRCSLAIPGRVNHNSLVLSVLIMGLLLAHTTRCITRKKKKWRLVKWVEKASFDRLNKLFGISTSERHHQTLLIDQNLLVVVRESQSFIFPILSRLAPKILEPNEHHTLNDLHSTKRCGQ